MSNTRPEGREPFCHTWEEVFSCRSCNSTWLLLLSQVSFCFLDLLLDFLDWALCLANGTQLFLLFRSFFFFFFFFFDPLLRSHVSHYWKFYTFCFSYICSHLYVFFNVSDIWLGTQAAVSFHGVRLREGELLISGLFVAWSTRARCPARGASLQWQNFWNKSIFQEKFGAGLGGSNSDGMLLSFFSVWGTRKKRLANKGGCGWRVARGGADRLIDWFL